ncbi:hypothetical protein WR25_13927 [Diploscapter pachys]|uniref:Uncharacterized protein n=1 Tax=Diploscapter pachys TaxID=2018661 RepID=A0A2A2K530_9BILA|nr:hypothetical protein WR25_13927 [Diploscapter pachys]
MSRNTKMSQHSMLRHFRVARHCGQSKLRSSAAREDIVGGEFAGEGGVGLDASSVGHGLGGTERPARSWNISGSNETHLLPNKSGQTFNQYESCYVNCCDP